MLVHHGADFISISSSATEIRTASSLPAPPNQYNVVARSGISVGQHATWSSQLTALTEPLPFEHIRDNIGEWSVLAQRNSLKSYSYLALTDHSGFGSIFYSLVPGQRIILADSFHGVIRGLEHHGTSRSLNIGNYLTAMSLPGTQFRTNFSSSTMANEVQLLSPGQMLSVSDADISLMPRKLADGPNPITDYETSIRGALESLESLLVLLPNLADGTFTHLSGGVDSRLIFAMVEAFGLATKYPVHSGDPRAVKSPASRQVVLSDVRIADLLRSAYNFEWWTNRQRRSIQLPFLEHLRSFQSFRSNLSFQYTPSFSKSILHSPQISLRGGGGEMLRTTESAETITMQKLATGKNEDTVNWLISYYSKSFIGHPEAYEIVASHLKYLLNEFHTDTLQEQLNQLYFNTRNRAHFGHMRLSFSGNDIPIHIPTHPQLLRASELLPHEARYEGKLIKDLFRLLGQERMLKFPFESPFGQRLSGKQVIPTTDHQWTREFDRINKQNPSQPIPKLWQLRGDHRLTRLELDDAASNFLILGMNTVRTLTPEHSKLLDNFHQRIIHQLKNNRIAKGPLLAKVASALDTFFPSGVGGSSLSYDTVESRYQTSTFSEPYSLRLPSLSTMFGSRGLTHRPLIIQDNTNVQVAANPVGRAPDELEFAFYLRLNGSKIDERWYTPEDTAEFSLDGLSGTVSVESFIRLKNTRGLPLRAVSNTLEI